MSPSATWPTTCRSMWGKPMPADAHTGEYLSRGGCISPARTRSSAVITLPSGTPSTRPFCSRRWTKHWGWPPTLQIELTAKEIHLRPNTRPCQVRTGALQPTLPAEDGWLMAVSAQEQTIYLDWHHFLADGRGMSRFAALLLKCYCNLRYGTDFCDPCPDQRPRLRHCRLGGALARTIPDR